MNFELDKQTVRDLEIFGSEKMSNSVFHFFNTTQTIGGKKFLFEIMQLPMTNLPEIQQRKEAIQYIYDTGFELSFDSIKFDLIDHYLNLNIKPLKNNPIDAYMDSFSYAIKPQNDYYIIQSGVEQLFLLFQHLDYKINTINEIRLPAEIENQIRQIKKFLDLPDTRKITTGKESISCIKLNKFDTLFREKYKTEVLDILRIIYTWDAYVGVARTARARGLSFPEYLTASEPCVSIKGLFHLLIEKAVPYDIETNQEKNLCFLTGPNMAGKSTFLKSLGLSVYLAHLGFPVPASQMKTTVFNGIVSTINLSDDRNLGYSHFYSEVKRVKDTALKIRQKGNLLVIFDELFRGTNVKDAYDASLLIIQSFAKITSCTFFISTHITEVAEQLHAIDTIQFKYFDSHLENDTPVYNYQLMNGISHERLGMMIIKNENIIGILNSIAGA